MVDPDASTILKDCGHSSVVERLVANEKVEGSTLPAPVYNSGFLMTDLSKKKKNL